MRKISLWTETTIYTSVSKSGSTNPKILNQNSGILLNKVSLNKNLIKIPYKKQLWLFFFFLAMTAWF